MMATHTVHRDLSLSVTYGYRELPNVADSHHGVTPLHLGYLRPSQLRLYSSLRPAGLVDFCSGLRKSSRTTDTTHILALCLAPAEYQDVRERWRRSQKTISRFAISQDCAIG